MKFLIFVSVLLFSIVTYGDDVDPLAGRQKRLLQEVSFHQHLGEALPMDITLQNEHGSPVTLAQCLSNQPTILVMAYYRCPVLCNQVLRGLGKAVRSVGLKPGSDFQVVVISFDPLDTPSLALEKKAAVLQHAGLAEDAPGWHFLVGEQEQVSLIAKTIGFEYQYDSKSSQYAHASGLVVLTPEGKTSRYFYGIDYPTRDLRLGLIEAGSGKIGNIVDELLLLCFHYDPATGRYGLAIINLIRLGGIVTVLAMAIFIGRSLRRERQQIPTAITQTSLTTEA
jgi:protein SCO1